MSDDDYPAEAIVPNIAGVSVLELDIGATGRVTDSRTILAAPSLVFDRVMESKLPGFRFAPAEDGGRPRACRALQQTIRWRMPEEEIPGPPLFSPVPEGST